MGTGLVALLLGTVVQLLSLWLSKSEIGIQLIWQENCIKNSFPVILIFADIECTYS